VIDLSIMSHVFAPPPSLQPTRELSSSLISLFNRFIADIITIGGKFMLIQTNPASLCFLFCFLPPLIILIFWFFSLETIKEKVASCNANELFFMPYPFMYVMIYTNAIFIRFDLEEEKSSSVLYMFVIYIHHKRLWC
jgi:hypothetical protein